MELMKKRLRAINKNIKELNIEYKEIEEKDLENLSKRMKLFKQYDFDIINVCIELFYCGLYKDSINNIDDLKIIMLKKNKRRF